MEAKTVSGWSLGAAGFVVGVAAALVVCTALPVAVVVAGAAGALYLVLITYFLHGG